MNGNEALSNFTGGPGNPISVRCKCELTISEKLDKKPLLLGAKDTGKGIRDKNELYRSNELCTITYAPDGSATIEMDDHFYIKASKLFVLTNRGPIKSYGLAESYVAQFSLQPIEIDGYWPPLLYQERQQGGQRWKDPFSVELYCVFCSLPMSPPTAQHELLMKTDLGEDKRADLSLEIDCGWSDMRTISRSQRGEPYQLVTRLPTPTSDTQQDSISEHHVLTCYFFLAPVDDERLQGYFGAPNTKNQHMFTIPGYTCPFCDGREFRDLTFLHLHLITSHDLFHFKVKQSKRTTGIRSSDTQYDSYLEIHVELSKEQVMSRPSDAVPDHRTFRWVKPTKRLDVGSLLKGDWSWLNEKKSTALSANYRREIPPPGVTVPPVPKKANLLDVEALPVRKRRKYIVPKARNGVTGLVFVRNRSKRFVHPGEELSESDDDVDEDWLKMKHEEASLVYFSLGICSRLISRAALTTLKMANICRLLTISQMWQGMSEASWFYGIDISSRNGKASEILVIQRVIPMLIDPLFSNHSPTGYAHIPQVLIRFARDKAEFLRNSNLLVEFWKHCLNLVQYGIIDSECLRVCMDLVKGDQWSSAGETQLGIGLAGPIALDNCPTHPPSTTGSNTVDTVDSGVKVAGRTSKSTPRDSGFCVCGNPFNKPQMTLCFSPVSQNMFLPLFLCLDHSCDGGRHNKVVM